MYKVCSRAADFLIDLSVVAGTRRIYRAKCPIKMSPSNPACSPSRGSDPCECTDSCPLGNRSGEWLSFQPPAAMRGHPTSEPCLTIRSGKGAVRMPLSFPSGWQVRCGRLAGCPVEGRRAATCRQRCLRIHWKGRQGLARQGPTLEARRSDWERQDPASETRHTNWMRRQTRSLLVMVHPQRIHAE